MSTRAKRPTGWFVPPPAITAYFSRALMHGVVLRVSRSFTFVFFILPANSFVIVAMPESLCRKLSATLSPMRSAAREPWTVAMTCPFLGRPPSFPLALNTAFFVEQAEYHLRDEEPCDGHLLPGY